ncbi:MAG: hypothetical protein LBU44_01725 [Mediterranea sp.]|jgi:iron complex outermembrane receptor protein|nr:hypothetical protein [Mediterranea sp.]
MKRLNGILFMLLLGKMLPLHAQDTITIGLDEIVISAKQGIDRRRQAKPGASVEEYLQSSGKAGMIRRGAYAWEPSINNMTDGRISVTIDGMKIFHACTDRMDPVTSYVETINLSKISIGKGFDANPNATGAIGGSLDLKLNKSGFCNDGFSANIHSGYESNGNLRTGGAEAAYAGDRFYINTGYFHRQGGNYAAGGGAAVRFSQFTKNNIFANLGGVVKPGHELEGSVIFDRAGNVGYPSLAMDVATAEGLIASLAYTRLFGSGSLPLPQKWETKIYYNNIVHIMDDTKRPPEEIAMHMDMPGKSQTGGFYSTLIGTAGKHRYSLNWDGYCNRSYAEMTMYPANPAEAPMFMLTWGDVRTLGSGLSGVDEWRIGSRQTLRVSGKLSLLRTGVHSDFGYRSLQGYHPRAKRFTNRLEGKIAACYRFRVGAAWEANLAAGYGSRTPTVSEAYGFFLFNTFDAFDYLGNPHLKNESSLETSATLTYSGRAVEATAEASHFRFANYIAGTPGAELHRMTAGARGVKVYRNLRRASLLNTSLLVKYRFGGFFTLDAKAVYARGRAGAGNLPLIAPFGYDASLRFGKGRFVAEASMAGAARQTDFSPEYGEDETKAYTITNLSAGYSFRMKKTVFRLKSGVENLFDACYSTYADWKNIPRKGRNLFINLEIEI